jgi:hypothetical protein
MFVLNFYVIVYTLVCYNQLARIGADDNDARDEKRRVTSYLAKRSGGPWALGQSLGVQQMIPALCSGKRP